MERKVEWNGEVRSIASWSRKLGIERGTIQSRLNKQGWSVEKALTTPVVKRANKVQSKINKESKAEKGLQWWINKVNWPVPGR